ncbi:MAG: hypothetical protein JZU65_24015 [Chlorobium sp.]|nr:hypothetical protein [Chlorobium sp.]
MSAGLSFAPKLIISGVTKNKGPLTKIMSLHPETGQVVKDGSECSMHSGTIKQIPISSPEGFAKMLASRQNNQAIVHGLSGHPEARVVTKGMVAKASAAGDMPVIARTKDYISYADGPGVILFDHDKARVGAVGSEEALRGDASGTGVRLTHLPVCQKSVRHPPLPERARQAIVSYRARSLSE